MSAPRLLVQPVDGYTLDDSYSVQRCPTDAWRKTPGCGIAYAFKLKSGDTVDSVTCPACGGDLTTSTRRLRQGFVVLTEADVKAIQDASGYTARRSFIIAARLMKGPRYGNVRQAAIKNAWEGVKGVPTPVSVLAPVEPAPASDPVLDAEAAAWAARSADVTPAPAPAKSAKLVAAEKALADFDAKPRCSSCWAYNASVKRSPLCGFCREWGTDRVTAEGERDGYAWRRQELVARVEKYGGTAPEAPVAGYAAHIEARDARRKAEREARIASLRARGVRV